MIYLLSDSMPTPSLRVAVSVCLQQTVLTSALKEAVSFAVRGKDRAPAPSPSTTPQPPLLPQLGSMHLYHTGPLFMSGTVKAIPDISHLPQIT